MKKFIIVLIFTFSAFLANAQVSYYRTTHFAYKQANRAWTDWESSNLKIKIDFNNDLVRIYSQEPQIYKITKYISHYYDNDEGETIKFAFIDQDGDRGEMRLRVTKNGTSQIYIDFSNISWVYNVVLM